MEIQIDKEPAENINYLVVDTGGRDEQGYIKIKEVPLPIYLGEINGLKTDLEYLIIASDLQGIVKVQNENKLLGEVLPEYLKLFFEIELPEVDLQKVGVFLCGDLFATLESRGGFGDVKEVWRQFNQYFRFVVGIAGNHDDFGSKEDFEAFQREEGIYFLHKKIIKVAGIKVGGIGGIIGNPNKPQRVEKEEYLKTLKKILVKQPDFILLHESPNNKIPKLEGHKKIREVIDSSRGNTICSGHCYWEENIIKAENNNQMINVDAKCMILKIVN